MDIEQHIKGFTDEGEVEVVYTLRAGGREVQVSNLRDGVLWESRVETNWVVMVHDDPKTGVHREAGFYLYDDGTLEVTRVENGEKFVDLQKPE